MHKRREFLVRTATLVLTTGLAQSHISTLKASINQPGGRRSTTFFVGGNNASDANPGTSSAPFATIQAAANVAMPGMTVRIRDGIYRETVVVPRSGTAQQPITFDADVRSNGTLTEPVISGAELIPDELWTLTTTGVDSVLGPQGNIYHADVTLPAGPGVAPRTDPTFVNSNTALAGNQVFLRGRQVNITSWPKRVDHESLMDRRQWFDPTKRIQPPGANTNELTAPYVMRLNLANNRMRLQDPSIPSIDWTGAWVFNAFTYLPNNFAIIDSGVSAGGVPFIEWDIDGSDGVNLQRNDYNSYSHQLQVIGAKALMTVGDSRNEWFYQDGRLLVRPPVDGAAPTGVEYKARNLGFDCTGRSYIHIKNINFFACEWTESGFDARSETEPGAPLNGGTAGNLVERCRFRYLHHWNSRPQGVTDGFRPENRWPLFVLRTQQHAYIMQHGLRLTGAGTTVRSSVISQCAGNAFCVSGEDAVVENNYIEEVGYRSGWAASVYSSTVYRATVTRNTMRRCFRSHINHIGQNKDISYNDMSEFMMLSNDGACIYGNGRYTDIHLGRGGQDVELNYWLAGRPSEVTGVAAGGGLNSIQLATTANAADNFYVGARIYLTALRQEGVITAYVGSTRTATVEPARSDEATPRIFFSAATGTPYTIRFGIGTLTGAFDGTRIHHNWIYDSLSRTRVANLPGETGGNNVVSRAWYNDGDTDGAIFDHNVTWNCHAGDHNGNPEGLAAVGPYNEEDVTRFELAVEASPGKLDPSYIGGKFNRFYNNTHATEIAITVDAGNNGGYVEGVSHSANMDGEQALYPDTYNNNIYYQRHTRVGVNAASQQSTDPPGKVSVFKSTELGLRRAPNGTSSAPEVGGYSIQPTSIFVNPGSRGTRPDKGLGFLLRTDIINPAIGRGVRIDGTLDNNGNPIVGVDDPSLAPGQRPDCGAYQTGGEAWVPGCDLPQEFIEGQPWENQWA